MLSWIDAGDARPPVTRITPIASASGNFLPDRAPDVLIYRARNEQNQRMSFG
jgi:hypothetical protein